MKKLSAIFAFSLTLFLFSCGNEPAKEETKTADTATAAVAEPPAPAKPAFTPFKVVVIQHQVKNFQKSKAGYMSNDSLREAYGITHLAIGRLLKDSNTIFVLEKIQDVDKAKAYFALPKVKTAMNKAGSKGGPAYSYAEMARMADVPGQYSERLAVTHHVKDYDAWLKAFDATGPSVRAEHGLIDLGIARDFYDPNTVSVMFAVTDMAKAKARMESPELKKIMKDSGVDSPPAIRWYREEK